MPVAELGLSNEGMDLLINTSKLVFASVTFIRTAESLWQVIKFSQNISSNSKMSEATSPGLCFAAGTLVATESGAKEIQDILPGDKVAAKNPLTGELEYKTVLQIFSHEENAAATLDVGNSHITSTTDHPYFIVGKGYTPAYLISPGQQVLTTYGTTQYVVGELKLLTKNKRCITLKLRIFIITSFLKMGF
jgi:hypothetical protein